MKRIKTYIAPALLAACLSLTACTDSNEPSNLPEDGKGIALSIAPAVEDVNSTPLTRATKMFFSDNDEISVSITTTATGAAAKDYTYIYTDGTFKGKDNKGFFFPLDNTAIKELTAIWPTKSTKEKSGIILDQREDKNFQQADELEARITSSNIMPTAAPLPLIFKHTQSRLTFKMAGQNANGLDIESLILELKYRVSGEGDSEVIEAGAFWAHCTEENGNAELILPAGTTIKAENATSTVNSDGRYMIGEATITGATNYTGGIWLDKNTNVELEAGYEYIVTLTPEGYNLVANFEIHGFNQGEGYIGIPIQMPTPTGTSNEYSIENCTQLVTLSQILAGNIKDAPADTWKAYTYILKSGLRLTEYAEKWYKKIDKSLKDNLFKDKVTTIKDHKGNDFSLFTE